LSLVRENTSNQHSMLEYTKNSLASKFDFSEVECKQATKNCIKSTNPQHHTATVDSLPKKTYSVYFYFARTRNWREVKVK
jgi:hypothetical protein